jgi:hypothetical protein
MKGIIEKLSLRDIMKSRLLSALQANGYNEYDAVSLVNLINPFRLETMAKIEGVKSSKIDLVQGQRANQANTDILQSSPLNNTLASNDTFIAFGAQVFLSALDTNNNAKLFTYPNALYFPKSTDDGNEDWAWYNVYRGVLSITSNGKTPIQGIPLNDALSVPQTQLLNLASGTAPNFTRANRDQFEATFDGYIDFGGFSVLTGDSEAKLSLDFPITLPTLANVNAGLFISLVGYIIRGQKLLI